MTEKKLAPKRQDMEEAATWLARLHADDCTDVDRRRFESWKASGEGQRRAFESVTDAFAVAGSQADRWRGELGAPIFDEPQERSGVLTRRAMLAGLSVGVGTIGWQAAYGGAVSTGFAERRLLRLKDGSSVQLDAETAVREPWLKSRTLEFRHGRISLQTSLKSQENFIVETSRHRIAGNAIDADLSLQGSRLAVSVLKGEVSVMQDGGPEIRLGAGERLGPEGSVDRPAMNRLLAWRQGRLIFENTPLGDACAQLNRYDGVRLVPDAEAATLRISGTFPLGRNGHFSDAVSELLPLRVSRQRNRIDLTGVATTPR